MCHERWWSERRARRTEESADMWQDFERTVPVADPAPPDDGPSEVRLETEDEVPVAPH